MINYLNTFNLLSTFVYPFSSHISRQGFECTKNKKDAIYDTIFMVIYSIFLLLNGYISDKFKIVYPLITCSLFGCIISSSLLYFYEYNIVIWGFHAFLNSSLWPISYKIAFTISDNYIIKTIWSLNGPLGDLLGCYLIKRTYLGILFYSISFGISFVAQIISVNIKSNNLIENLLENSENPENSENLENSENSENQENEFIKYKYKKIFSFLLTFFITINLKCISYSISNWYPLQKDNMYYLYNIGTIIGTVLTGLLLNYINKIELLSLIFSLILIFVSYFKVNDVLLGICFSICNTNTSLFLCEKNSKIVNGLSTMTAMLDCCGTITAAILQLFVYEHYDTIIFISEITLSSFFLVLYKCR